jgi:hypothetical protein
MLWVAKLNGKQPLKITEGTTELLIITNASLVESSVKADETVKVLVQIGNEKLTLTDLSTKRLQTHLQLLLSIGDTPEIYLSSKTAEVHLIGYFYVMFGLCSQHN